MSRRGLTLDGLWDHATAPEIGFRFDPENAWEFPKYRYKPRVARMPEPSTLRSLRLAGPAQPIGVPDNMYHRAALNVLLHVDRDRTDLMVAVGTAFGCTDVRCYDPQAARRFLNEHAICELTERAANHRRVLAASTARQHTLDERRNANEGVIALARDAGYTVDILGPPYNMIGIHPGDLLQLLNQTGTDR